MYDEEAAQKELNQQIKAYKKLDAIKDSQEFKDFFEFQLKTVADKMLWIFLSGKDGDNVKNWEDFCKARGEVIARIQPLQEVYGAKAIINRLKDQLNKYYGEGA